MKQNMKKWLAGFLVLTLAFSGSGCGKKAQSTKQEKNQTESTDVDMQDTKLKADISFWSFQIGTWGGMRQQCKVSLKNLMKSIPISM